MVHLGYMYNIVFPGHNSTPTCWRIGLGFARITTLHWLWSESGNSRIENHRTPIWLHLMIMCRTCSLGFHMVFTWFLSKGRWHTRPTWPTSGCAVKPGATSTTSSWPWSPRTAAECGPWPWDSGHGKKRSWWKVMGCNYCLFAGWWFNSG